MQYRLHTAIRILNDLLHDRPPRSIDLTMLNAFGGQRPEALPLDEYACNTLQEVVRSRHRRRNTVALTERESEVLTLIALGLSSKQIAAELGMSFKTATCHREHLMTKLNAHNVVLLVHEAVRRGLLRL